MHLFNTEDIAFVAIEITEGMEKYLSQHVLIPAALIRLKNAVVFGQTASIN